MKQITWEVNYLSAPHIIRYCKKCQTKTEYQCSGAFRINAQKKTIDVWLIYKCIHCDSTWNMTIFSRIHQKSIPLPLLEGFHANDEELALKYSLDYKLLQKNGVDMCLPDFTITGDDIPFGIPVELIIKAPAPAQYKITKLLRLNMGLSNNELSKLIETGAIKSEDMTPVNKMTLKEETRVLIHLVSYIGLK